ncbi:S1 family peptidase [Alkalicoccobacillus murimartini]|uniref:S1-C subfamily serine protease n=1 Tax=Alkalicoccobacillus murimartini TaxID=171685 RepID=A0ABT9YEK0_9BACI|nr:serine protease [Alkalicoccobacillus murimartini]MDQ0206156.1 S1-C subfamily serine protease [Alkalicoccobacillus murimartini]
MHDQDWDDRRKEEIMEGEPEAEDFLPEPNEKQKKPKWWVKIGALVISLILIGNAGAFLFQHFGQDGRDLLSQSEELSGNPEIELYKESVVTVQRDQSRGTGFFYEEDGRILTNHHVADGDGPLIITTAEGVKYQGEVINEDEEADLAQIQIESDGDHPALTLSQDETDGGDEPVYIVGNPMTHNQIAISGRIIESQRQYDAVRIDASIFQGHSGSPVISESGEVIGVVYAKTVPGFRSEEESVGLAIPINLVHDFLAEKN